LTLAVAVAILRADSAFCRHPGEGRDPVLSELEESWIPAFAGMTV